jgi:hypothetical protein
MHRILLSLLLSLCAVSSSAQQDTKAKVHLTNGDVISGILIEYIPGGHLTIRTVGDNVVTIPQAEIRSVEMGNGATQTTTAATANTEPEQKTLGKAYFESNSEALMAVGIGSSDTKVSAPGMFFGAYSANGVGIGEIVFIGIGTGFQWHTQDPNYTIPFALDVRWRMLKGKKFSPIMAGMGGVGIHESGLGSILFGGSLGLNIRMKEKLGLNLMAFYHYHKFDKQLTAGGTQAAGNLKNVDFSYIGIRVGIQVKAGGK